MKTQSALINPVKLPDDLNEAERHFVKCVAAGKPCMFGTTRPKPDDKNAPVIRAEVIGFFVWGGSEENWILGNRIYLQGTQVREVLDLDYRLSPYMLVMADCHFNNAIKMAHAGFRYLNLSGSRLTNGFVGTGIQIDSDLVMTDDFYSDKAVVLLDAKIGGGMFCDRGTFAKGEFNTQTRTEEKSALSADRIKVGTNIVLGYGFSAKGGARFLGAQVGGYLDCTGGKFFKNEEGVALAADEIKIESNLMMQEGFCADGAVLFTGADIGGAAYCDEGEFGGVVRFGGANIGRDLLLRGSKIKNDNKGVSLYANRAKVGGDVSMSRGFSATGFASFMSADIGGVLSCEGGNFKNGLFAQGAKIKDALVFSDVKGSGEVNLSFASVDVFTDDEKSQDNFNFDLTGFSYSRFLTPTNAKSRINWLGRRPASVPFSPQPFEQAAKVLFSAGHDIDARKILLAKEKMLTEHGNISGALKFCRRWWDRFAGYGYQLWKTLAWSVGVIIAGAVVFNFADDACHIVPSQPAVVVSEKYMNAQTHKCAVEGEPTKATVRLFPEYSEFQPLAYSVDVFFPFFALHQEPYWEPKPGGETNEIVLYALRFLFWLEVALGWLLTSLAVLSITGLLRPRQSSGDKE